MTFLVPSFQNLIDNQVTYKYIGTAASGASTSEPVWEIIRLKLLGNEITEIKYADGNASFDNVWDDRASLSYL